jgi:hypothetical protein
MPGTLPGEGAEHPSVTDTSVIVGLIPPLAVSANKSLGCYTVLSSTVRFQTNVSFCRWDSDTEPLAWGAGRETPRSPSSEI